MQQISHKLQVRPVLPLLELYGRSCSAAFVLPGGGADLVDRRRTQVAGAPLGVQAGEPDKEADPLRFPTLREPNPLAPLTLLSPSPQQGPLHGPLSFPPGAGSQLQQGGRQPCRGGQDVQRPPPCPPGLGAAAARAQVALLFPPSSDELDPVSALAIPHCPVGVSIWGPQVPQTQP